MEELEKSIRVNKLIDFYGDLLTSHQKEILSLYYQMDLSLSEISEQLEKEYMEKYIGKIVEILPEKVKENILTGHTENYLQVKTKGKKEDINKLIKVKIKSLNYPYLEGEKLTSEQ